MSYKAIIFDMDGTIVDTEHIWLRASRELIEKRGICYTDELHCKLIPKIKGMETRQTCLIIKDMVQLTDCIEELVQEKNKMANELYATGIRFIEGFAEFHQKIVEKKLKHGIATNAASHTVELTDKALNIRKFFGEHIYSIDCVGKICKPRPDIYLHAAAQLSCLPFECIAIEDSAHGVRAAKSAGMLCIGINTAGDAEQLTDADIIVDTYSEIDIDQILKAS